MNKKIFLFIILILLFPLTIKAETKYLYDVLKNEAENGGLAKEYTGEHHDSFVEEPSKKIYHWYANNQTEGAQLLEKYNVIFADHCWQMIRTTDTGGVKLLYNGEVEDGKCLSTRENHYGFNNDPHVRNGQYLYDNYYYSTDYYFDDNTQEFVLSGEVTTGSVQTKKYTCASTSNRCSILFFVNYLREDGKYDLMSYLKDVHYSILGRAPYSFSDIYMSDFSYMNNKSHDYDFHLLQSTLELYLLKVPKTTYWYANDIRWNNTTNKWELVSPFKVTTITDAISGKYTFFNTDSSFSSEEVYYIVGYSGSSAYHLTLKNGNNLDNYNTTFSYGNSFHQNNDGTYTIENATNTDLINLFSHVSNLLNKYVCLNPTNDSCEELIFVSRTYNYKIEYYSTNRINTVANNVVYENNRYVLTGEKKSFWQLNLASINDYLLNTHYVCLNGSNICEKVAYIYYSKDASIYYFELQDGKKIEDFLQETLYDDDVNLNDSNAKIMTEKWYEHYMLPYSNYIEDIIYCNNRTIKDISGFNPNGGSIIDYLRFQNDNNILCQNETDSFSVSNSKAKLKYPVGLMTISDYTLSNYNQLYTSGMNYWTMQPSGFYINLAYVWYIKNNDGYNGMSVTHDLGFRPVISVKPRTKYLSGTGTKEDPYVLSLEKSYKINIEINNETNHSTIDIESINNIYAGEEVPFKLTPAKGYKITNLVIKDTSENEIEYIETDNSNEYTFTMPASDVTIIPTFEKVTNAVNTDNNSHTKQLTIEVEDAKAVIYEDEVRFIVVPEDGYELETIEITDEDGNNIEYHKTNKENEYSFVMPATDVLIKPIYRRKEEIPINPHTKTPISIIVLLLTIIAVTTVLFKYKKRLS